MVEQITSFQNPKVKKAVRLSDRRERNLTGLFLIEGYRELRRASDSGLIIQTLFICPGLFLGSNEHSLIEQIRKKGAELLSILKATLFREKARVIRPEFLRARIKRRVIDNLDEDFQYPEVIDVVTDSLVQAAKQDPRYRKILGLEENLA